MAAVAARRLWCLSPISRYTFRRPSRYLCSTNEHADTNHDFAGKDESTVDPEAIKLQILETAISHHVGQHGWTRKSLQEAATALEMPSVVHGLFPNGGFDLVNHFYRSRTAMLASELEEEPRKPTESFIRRALQTRLNMVTPHVDTWPQAMALQALPQYAPTSIANLAALADEIWFLAGDTSTDFSWYTKRLEVGFIYKTSELFLLQDRSPSFADTWSFMDRRLEDIQSSGARLSSLFSTGASARELLTGLGLIAKNVTRT